MAALLWRLLLLTELVCALGLAAALPATPVLAALGLLSLWPCVAVGISFMLACAMRNPRRSANGGSGIHLLRAWLSECVAFQQARLAMSVEPCRSWPSSATANRPVLLIHGVVCNRGAWRVLARRLRDGGFGPVRAVNLEPLHADIDSYATQAVRELRQLRHDCRGARVTIVAHSMGGLVARAALRLAGPDDIAHIVTLGSPHHGCVLSAVLPDPPSRQMRTGSPWLETLNAAQEGRFRVPVTAIYSTNDNLVFPTLTATLKGATNIELRGVGHLGLLSARRSIDQTIAALRQEGAHA